jgi:hypothetical protein
LEPLVAPLVFELKKLAVWKIPRIWLAGDTVLDSWQADQRVMAEQLARHFWLAYALAAHAS